jgi:hypothetical protein
MSLQSTFSRVDRHAAWGARPISASILVGFGLLAGAGMIFAPELPRREAEIATAAMAWPAVSSPCVPHDGALGNDGGDPYAFYVFNREEELAQLRAGACPSIVAQTSGKQSGSDSAAPEIVAQIERSRAAPAATAAP